MSDTPDIPENPEQPDRPISTDDTVTLTVGELDDHLERHAHAVGRVHRRRVAVQSFFAALIVSVAGLIVTLSILDNADTRSARYDCDLVQTLARSNSDFVASDARVRKLQAKHNITPQLIKDLAGKIPATEVTSLLAQANDSLHESRQVVHHWDTVDLPPLRKLETLECRVGLGERPISTSPVSRTSTGTTRSTQISKEH